MTILIMTNLSVLLMANICTTSPPVDDYPSYDDYLEWDVKLYTLTQDMPLPQCTEPTTVHCI